MFKYKRVIASFLAAMLLIGAMPLAALRADEVEETDAEVVIEETTEEDAEETDETIFEEPAEVGESFEEISEEDIEVEDAEEVEEVAEELPAEEVVVEPEEDLATGVEGFINRIYSVALGRTPDAGGRTYWINQINRGKTGADVARNFLFSSEFLNKNMTNSQFLDVIYRVFFDRDADASGKQFYLNKMANGWTKQQVINAFIDSTEWANICQRYGIASGSRATPTLIRDFVTRLYTTCLNRSEDPSGLSYYVNLLTNHTLTGTEVAQRFFFSQEMLNKRISNDEFIRRLYRTCFDREADLTGYRYWRNKMNVDGWFREDVFNSFVTSAEWQRICEESGISVGSPIAVRHAPGATWANLEGEWVNPTDNSWHYVGEYLSSDEIVLSISNDLAFQHYYMVYKNGRLVYTSQVVNSANYRVVLNSNCGVPVFEQEGTDRYSVYYYAADGTLVYTSWCDVDTLSCSTFDFGQDFYQVFHYYFVFNGLTYGDSDPFDFHNNVSVSNNEEDIRFCLTTGCYREEELRDGVTLYYRLYYFETIEDCIDNSNMLDTTDNMISSGRINPAMGTTYWSGNTNYYYYYEVPLEQPYEPGYYQLYVFDHEDYSYRYEYLAILGAYVADR